MCGVIMKSSFFFALGGKMPLLDQDHLDFAEANTSFGTELELLTDVVVYPLLV